ncbi:hypothetical protein SAMN02745116_02004 [Pilibacter termitis]|uniref:Mga helix-turn-helix domain-containing protein n=1 Tax=Pilibacter termitis TaxID=263852 RepID=A0A1T4PZP7_9ENTE|nr:hypothetical protein [Pilibacter termitis]SJZ96983.1 hypothetical protein SAMN02745116_02004 [Pilibacter termitis]
MMEKKIVLKKLEERELNVFTHLLAKGGNCTFKEMSEELFYGVGMVRSAVERLQLKIETFSMQEKMTLEVNGQKVLFSYDKKEDIQLFIQKFYQETNGFRLFSEIFQNPDFVMRRDIEKLGMSETVGRELLKGLNGVNHSQGSQLISRGLNFTDNEPLVREQLFQFWWMFRVPEVWVLRSVDEEKVRTFVDCLTEVLGFPKLSKRSLERVMLKVGIQFLRVQQGEMMNEYQKMYGGFYIRMGLERRVLDLLDDKGLDFSIEEVKHLFFILCSERIEWFEDEFLCEELENANKLFCSFVNKEWMMLEQSKRESICQKTKSLLFRVMVLGQTTLSIQNVNDYQKSYENLFGELSEISFSLLEKLEKKEIRPIKLVASIFDEIEEEIQELRLIKIFIEKEIDLLIKRRIIERIKQQLSYKYPIKIVTELEEEVTVTVSMEECGKENTVCVSKNLTEEDLSKIETCLQLQMKY